MQATTINMQIISSPCSHKTKYSGTKVEKDKRKIEDIEDGTVYIYIHGKKWAKGGFAEVEAETLANSTLVGVLKERGMPFEYSPSLPPLLSIEVLLAIMNKLFF